MKRIYSISYDLRRPGRNYDDLYSVLNQYEHYHALESTWFVKSEELADTICEKVREKMDNTDSVIVTEIVIGNKQGWMPKPFWEWINSKQ